MHENWFLSSTTVLYLFILGMPLKKWGIGPKKGWDLAMIPILFAYLRDAFKKPGLSNIVQFLPDTSLPRHFGT